MNHDSPKSPLCTDGVCDLERRVDASSIRDAWRQMGLDLTSDLDGIESISLWRCRRSQLQFYSPAPVGAEELYRFIARQDWYYARRKWEFTKAAELIKAEGCGEILEVGCGSGAFLETARNIGLTARGIDLNSSAVSQARSIGLSATTEPLEQVIATGRRFSAVCAFQVLEHVENPGEFISQTVRLVEFGGLLIFCTPDGDGWLGNRLQPLDLPPHHVTRWGRAAFAFLPQIHPIELVALSSEPLSPNHYGAWAAALVDPDAASPEVVVRCNRRMSKRQRVLVAALRVLRRLVKPSQSGGGQSLMAVYRRR